MRRKSTFFRAKSRSDDILQFATTIANLGKELATISSFPPAVAAVSALLVILETVQEVKTNQEACMRLAQRAAKTLIDVNNQMEGRWETAPESLVKNLEKYRETLATIQRYMTLQANVKWTKQLVKKGSVTESLSELDELLTDATQGFQTATLINIHHAVSSPLSGSSNDTYLDNSTPLFCSHESASPTSEKTGGTIAPQLPLTPINYDDFIYLQDQPEYPFHRYTTSEKASGHHFQKYKLSAIRVFTTTKNLSGWWSSATGADINGQNLFVKVYNQEPENAIRDWLQDVKLLQNIFHPNLPQMIGSSARNAPVPFVLLADVLHGTPREVIMEKLRSRTMEDCVEMVLQFYGEIQDAALFLRQSLHLVSVQLQSYLDDVSIGTDKLNSIILSLPTYSKGHYLTYRNHGVVESLKHICMGLLPYITDETDEADKPRINELFSTINRRFFPLYGPVVEHHAFLDDDNDDNIDLTSAFGETAIPNRAWRRYRPCKSHRFAAGDFGYVPKGAGIESFIKLGTTCSHDLSTFSVTENAFGVRWGHNRKPDQPFTLSQSSFIGDLACWSLAVEDNRRMTGQVVHQSTISQDEACRFLLESGETIANKFHLERQSLRLVTSVENKQDFDICNYSYSTSRVTTLYFHTALRMKRCPYFSHDPVRVEEAGIPLPLEPGWICTTKVRAGTIQTVSLGAGTS